MRSVAKIARLLAFGVLLLWGGTPADAGLIVSDLKEVSAADSSFVAASPAPSESRGQLPTYLSMVLEPDTSLPGSGSSGSTTGAGGPPSVAYISSGHPLRRDTVRIAWLARSRYLFCPTLLPSGLFRPPRLAS
ncbi:MAG: hypothetical protein ACREHD_16280 [Pirellulales bacterium]